jgi:hypothetical protein
VEAFDRDALARRQQRAPALGPGRVGRFQQLEVGAPSSLRSSQRPPA